MPHLEADRTVRCPPSRRAFLTLGATATASLLDPGFVLAGPSQPGPPRALAVVGLHTGESLDVIYWAEGHYLARALGRIDHVLRDHRTGEVAAVDRRLLDLLHSLSRALGSHAPFEVISGYRSPATNAMLRRGGEGVARSSLHMQGRAIDIRLPGVRLDALRRAALDLRGGGVGYYPRSDFVHVDTGGVRAW